MALKVGDELRRKSGGGSVRLVGIDGAGRWIAEPVGEFGPPFSVESAELVSEYRDVTDPTAPPQVDEAALRRADAKANAQAVRGYRLNPRAQREARTNEANFARTAAAAGGAEDLRSPEDIFRQTENADDGN